MACSTGDACGFTETRSSGPRCANHNAVMIDTIDAELAWWPPTLIPPASARSWLAASTMRTASHSTRCWISSSASRSVFPTATEATASGAAGCFPLAMAGEHAVPKMVEDLRRAVIETEIEQVGHRREPLVPLRQRLTRARTRADPAQHQPAYDVHARSVSALGHRHPHEAGFRRRRQPSVLLHEVGDTGVARRPAHAGEATGRVVREVPAIGDFLERQLERLLFVPPSRQRQRFVQRVAEPRVHVPDARRVLVSR